MRLRDQSQILGEERDRLDEGRSMAGRALHPVVEMDAVAAALAEGVSADHKQPGDVEFFVELEFAVGAEH